MVCKVAGAGKLSAWGNGAGCNIGDDAWILMMTYVGGQEECTEHVPRHVRDVGRAFVGLIGQHHGGLLVHPAGLCGFGPLAEGGGCATTAVTAYWPGVLY